MTEPDGRDLLAALQIYRREAEEWEKATRSMEASVERFQAEIMEQLAALEDQLNAERRAHLVAQRRSWLYVALAGGIGYLAGR